MSRYNAGQKVWFIDVRVNPETDVVEKAEFLQLTCHAGAKVPWRYAQAEQPEYDGYIFKDNGGNRWHNQYPFADFGQLDDSANWKVTFAGEAGDTKARIEGGLPVRMADFEQELNNLLFYMSTVKETQVSTLARLRTIFQQLATAFTTKTGWTVIEVVPSQEEIDNSMELLTRHAKLVAPAEEAAVAHE